METENGEANGVEDGGPSKTRFENDKGIGKTIDSFKVSK